RDERLLSLLQSSRLRADRMEMALARAKKSRADMSGSIRVKLAMKLPKSVEQWAWVRRLGARDKVSEAIDKDAALALRSRYAEWVDRVPLDPRHVLLESFYGRGLISNPLAIFE